MSFEELNVPKNHIYLFKPHSRKAPRASILSITNPKCQYRIILINACQTPRLAGRLLVVLADALPRLPRGLPHYIAQIA